MTVFFVRMSPKIWKQVVIINCEIDDKLHVPVLFALLPDKATVSYEAVFKNIKQFLTSLEIPNLTAEYAMADFELALRNAWVNVFPDIPLQNCMFHYDKVRYF